MEFAFTYEVSEKVSESNMYLISSEIEQEVKIFLRGKTYNNLKKFLIGIICVMPQFDLFLK